MQMSRACLGSLINKYKAVLRTCRVKEAAGALTLGALLTVGAGPFVSPFMGQALAAEDVTVAEGVTRDVGDSENPGNLETLEVGKLTMNGKMEVVAGGTLQLDSFVVGTKGNLHLDGGVMKLGSDAKGWQDARVRIHDDVEASTEGKVSIGDGGNLHLGTLTLDPWVGHEYRLGSEVDSTTQLEITLNKLVGEKHQNPSGQIRAAIFVGDDTANGPSINFRAQKMASASSEYVFMEQDLVIVKGTVTLGVGDAETQGIHTTKDHGNTFVLGGYGNTRADSKLIVEKGEWRVGDLALLTGELHIKQGAKLGLYNSQHTVTELEKHINNPKDAAVIVGEGKNLPNDESRRAKKARLLFLEDTKMDVSFLGSNIADKHKFVILKDGVLEMGDDTKLTLTVTDTNNTLSIGGEVQASNLDVKKGDLLADLNITSGGLTFMGNHNDDKGSINAGTITVQHGSFVSPSGKGGMLNANLTANGGMIVVDGDGSAWTLAEGKVISVGKDGSLLTAKKGSLDTSLGTLKVASDATTFKTDAGTQLHINATDVTMDGSNNLTGNIQKKLDNDGTLKVTGTNLADADAFQTFRAALTTGKGMITLASQNPNEWVTENTTLADVDSKMSGLDLTQSVVKAKASGTDTLTGNVFVGQIDATGITGEYTVTGGSLTVAGKGAGEQLFKTTDANAKVTVDNLQLGMNTTGAGTQQNLTVGTQLDVVGGSYTVGTLNVQDTHLQGGGKLHVQDMTATGNITVGNEQGSGQLIAEKIQLGGNTLFADPAWVTGGVHDGTFGSLVALKDLDGADKNVVDGVIIAGQASQISLRTTDTVILSGLLQKSQAWGTDITAALYVDGPVKLDATKGAIYVNGALNDANALPTAKDTATFADKSLLVVNAANLGTGAAITGTIGTSTATVAAGSRLHLTNAKSGDEYTILGDFKTITYATGGFSGVGNLLQTVEVLNPSTLGNSLTVKVEAQAAGTVFTNLDNSLGNMLNEMNDRGLFHTDSDQMGQRFLSRAVDGRLSASEAEATIEGAARMGMTGGAQQATIAATQAAVAATSTRLSLALPTPGQNKSTALHMDADSISADAGLSAGDGMKNGVGLWITPLYQSMNSWGMKAGNFKSGISGDMGGVALGADYTFNEALRLGVTFNIGAGYAKSSGDFSETDNSFNFWGVGLYGGWMQDNFGLSADVNYTSSYNKMQQDLPATMSMGDLKSDVQTQAISAGLRGEYKWETSVLDITPHIGVRYLSLGTDSYSIESAGQKVFKGDAIHQSIWTFPIGVTLGKTLESDSGWNFTPRVDLAVIPAAGDIQAKGTVKVPGLGSSADLSTQVMDYISYQGGLGFDLGKDGFSMGLNYTVQAGEHSTAHGLNATFRYEF